MSSNIFFSTLSLLSSFLVFLPLPWHMASGNVGTTMYMLWTGIASLKFGIDSIIWNGNAIDWAPIWCDISTRIHLGAQLGVPASSLCINRRLYYISTTSQVNFSRSEKHRMVIIDLFICLGVGLLAIPLQYLVQGHRYNILEDVGCYPFTVSTPPAFLLVHLPPVIIGLVSGGYCVGSIISFNKRRSNFNSLLRTTSSNINADKYWRLMALATIEAVSTVPLGLYILIIDITSTTVHPYSWKDIHRGFSRVDQIPAMLWRADKQAERNIEFSRWAFVMCGLLFFAFFGFANEARKNYEKWGYYICGVFGYKSTQASGVNLSRDTGPIPSVALRIFARQDVNTSKQSDSLDLIPEVDEDDETVAYFEKFLARHAPPKVHKKSTFSDSCTKSSLLKRVKTNKPLETINGIPVTLLTPCKTPLPPPPAHIVPKKIGDQIHIGPLQYDEHDVDPNIAYLPEGFSSTPKSRRR